MNKEVGAKGQRAGAWRRIFAFAADALVLVLLGNLVGLLAGQWLSLLGYWALLVGFLLCALYFGVFDSALTQGQTPGKKLLKIAVVNARGSALNPAQALLRFSVLGAPYFIAGLKANQAHLQHPGYLVLLFIILAPLLCAFYLFVFNRATGQSLQDLIVPSRVVLTHQQDEQSAENTAMWKGHWVVVGLMVIATAFGPYFLIQSQLSRVQNQIMANGVLLENPLVRYSEIQYTTRELKLPNQPQRMASLVNVDIELVRDQIEHRMLAQNLALSVFQHYPKAANASLIQVNLRYGFNMQLASGWREMSYQFEPAALQGLSR